MSGWVGAIVGVVAILALWSLRNVFSTHGRFWRLAGKHPDLALALFEREAGVVIDTAPSPRQDYVGPFTIFSSSGRRHTVYIIRSRIEAIQAKVSADIKELG